MFDAVDVLIHVEDPGAANYVAQLPAALQNRHISSVLLADGRAVGYLSDRQVPFVSIPESYSARQLLAIFTPCLTIVGTSENVRSRGLLLVPVCRQQGVVSVGVIDMLVNAELRFRGESKSALEYAPDWLLVPDATTKLAFKNLGFHCEQILECGHPHYDHVLEAAQHFATQDRFTMRQRIFPKIMPDDTVLTFIAEPPSTLNPQLLKRSADYTLLGSGKSVDRTIIVLEELLEAIAHCPSRPYVVVRLHPKNTLDEFQAHSQMVDYFSVGGNPLEVVWSSDLVVGMSSMLLQESALMGKTTLSILPRKCEQFWMPCTSDGYTPSVTTRQDLEDILPKLLHRQSTKSSFTQSEVPSFHTKDALEKVSDFIAAQVTTIKESRL